MSARTVVFRPLRSLAQRSRPVAPLVSTAQLHTTSRRNITAKEKPLPTRDSKSQGPGPNSDPLPHVSQEAAETCRISGEGGPELEQGTPVEEILSRDEKAREHAPQVLKDEVEKASATSGGTNGSGTPKGTRSYSTSTRRMTTQQQDVIRYEDDAASVAAIVGMGAAVGGGESSTALSMQSALEGAGHKFGLPTIPLGPHAHKNHRYDVCVKQITALMMKDGKLSKAQSNMTRVLNHLRTSPAPNINPQRPLLPGAPPASHLPLNPALYLQLAIDSVAPLIKLRRTIGLAGGGAAVPVPMPLRLKQRRRQAFKWVLEVVEKKPSRGSGKGQFAQRVAEELIAIVEGKSGVWEKRLLVHRTGTAARSNVGKKPRSRTNR